MEQTSQHMQTISRSSTAFKNGTRTVDTVPFLIHLIHPCLPEDRLFETGWGRCETNQRHRFVHRGREKKFRTHRRKTNQSWVGILNFSFFIPH